MPAGYDISLDDWPLIRVRMDDTMTVDDAHAYIADLDQIYARKQRVAWITTIDQFRTGNREVTKPLAYWMRDHKQTVLEFSCGTAMVNDSAMFRFFMSSVFLIQPIPGPYTIVGTLEQAESWIRGQFVKLGVPVPPALQNVE